MRINVYAESQFLKDRGYPNFSKLLAACAAGIVDLGADPGSVIDIQINPVLTAHGMDQFVFTAGTSGSFSESSRGKTTLSMEICCVDNISESNADLLCESAVALAYSWLGIHNNVNCWLRRHGDISGTGWCDKEFSPKTCEDVGDIVQAFVYGRIDGKSMINSLSWKFAHRGM